MAKAQKAKKPVPGRTTKARRNHRKNRTQSKMDMGMGFSEGQAKVKGADGRERVVKVLRVRPGVNSPLYVDQKDPVLAAQQADAQHYKSCRRCQGLVKLKHLTGFDKDGKAEFRMVVAPCNRGKALHKRYQQMVKVAAAPTVPKTVEPEKVAVTA